MPQSIARLLDLRADRTPGAPFLVGEAKGVPLSYGEVSRRTEEIGEALVRLGLHPGDRALLAIPNGLAFPLLYLALLARGITVVPVNPEATLREADRIMELARPHALFVAASLSLGDWTSLAGSGPTTTFTPVAQEPVAFFGPFPRKAAHGGVAELLFTSGTTGAPKGVGLTEAHLLHTARQIREAHRLTEKDVCYSPLPLHHINAEVVGVLATLVAGGSLVIGRRFSASGFWETIRRHGVTWVTGVPPILTILLRQGREAGAPHGLRFFRSASAPLPVPVLQAFEATYGIPVIETYGLTEAASQVASNPLPPAVRKPGSVGLPWGMEVRVVDDAGRRLPPGATGEIAVRGEGVVTRYAVGGEMAFRDGWFMTGDLGHMDGDGYLFITGRRTDMINRGGQKVAPREVEEVLMTHPAVADVAVGPLPDPVLGQKVGAWVVLAGRVSEETAEEAIRAHARAYLSGYKRPEHIVFVKALPKSETGKVKRHLLRS